MGNFLKKITALSFETLDFPLAFLERTIVLKLQTRKEKLCCSVCNSKNYIRSGFQVRRIGGVPIGRKAVILEIKV